MFLFLFITSCISLASGYRNSDFLYQDSDDAGYAGELFWPETYSVKITQMSMTSQLVMEVQQWKNNQSSRIDYNGGSVISLATLGINNSAGITYEILSQTMDGEKPVETCYQIPGKDRLTSILPLVNEEFDAVGNETVLSKETVRFEANTKNDGRKIRITIWAEYVLYDGETAWIPVRYEKKVFNVELGSLITYDIWEFHEFTFDFDDDVFNVVDQYDCESPNSIKYNDNSDKVLKELMFINPHDQEHIDHVFDNYIANFNRKYAHEEEHAMRKAIFHENMRIVSSVNKKNAGYKLAMNEFSDRTPEELKMSMGLVKRAPRKAGNIEFPYDEAKIKEIVENLPKEYDARLDNLVSPVKNQGSCASCYAFGATAAAEGALAKINGGRLMSLSEQALVDCVWLKYGAAGCHGGTDTGAFSWMMDHGLPTEEEYGPYKNKEDYCHVANMTKFPIRGFTDVTSFSNGATKVAVVNHGPLSVGVSTTEQFMSYSSGVFYQKNCDSLKLTHEVALVGYGERYGDLYWILKNSWGTSWGMDGYMLISAKDNICGITTEPTYVVF